MPFICGKKLIYNLHNIINKILEPLSFGYFMVIVLIVNATVKSLVSIIINTFFTLLLLILSIPTHSIHLQFALSVDDNIIYHWWQVYENLFSRDRKAWVRKDVWSILVIRNSPTRSKFVLQKLGMLIKTWQWLMAYNLKLKLIYIFRLELTCSPLMWVYYFYVMYKTCPKVTTIDYIAMSAYFVTEHRCK